MNYTTYTIKSGDTLSKIAKQFKTTAGALAQANGIKNANLIRAGQTLVVPDVVAPSPSFNPADDVLQEVKVTARPVRTSTGTPSPAAKAGVAIQNSLIDTIRASDWFKPPKLYYLFAGAAAIVLLFPSGKKR